MPHPQIAQRVFHTPLLLAQSKAAAVVRGLGPRLIGSEQIEFVGVTGEGASAPARQPFASLLDDRMGEEIRSGRAVPFRVIDRVAVIPITGTLIHRGAWVGSYSGETSYEGIGAAIDAAANDPHLRGIALEVDSFGGEVAGCFDLAARIRAAREKKSVAAFVSDHAFSAGYALASQADTVIVPRAGGVGSIGVICLHVDYSQQLSDVGIRVSIIAAGDHKADANPYEPLPNEVRDNLKADMESLRQIFAETVAAGRGDRLTTEQALATEAQCFLGEAALEVGLADEVASPADAFKDFLTTADAKSGSTIYATTKGTVSMTTTTKTPETEDTTQATPAAKTPSAPAPDSGVQEPAADTSNTSADAVADERERIMGILTCDEAKGREEQANALAKMPGMSVEGAKTVLAAGAAASASGQLTPVMQEEDTDLDGTTGVDANAPANPVLAAQQKRWGTTG